MFLMGGTVLAEAEDVPGGDVNADGTADISDPIALLGWLFLGSPAPLPAACPSGRPGLQNGDANGDGGIDVSDPVHLLNWLFDAGPAPAPIPCLPSHPCLDELDRLGVRWSSGPESPGVEIPVTVTLPIGGISFRQQGASEPRSTWFMDCELARALHAMAQLLESRGIVEALDLGIYNYRCIAEGIPPDCPNGISLHAYARAVDIAGLVSSEGTVHSVLEDWVIDVNGATCMEGPRAGSDAFLHEVICDIYRADIFNIHLTPNYNADHRNHWHLDLTAEANFIR